MAEAQKATDIMADKADTLILDMTSNVTESYMSTVAKVVGGKRADFAKGNGHNQRCETAAFVQ